MDFAPAQAIAAPASAVMGAVAVDGGAVSCMGTASFLVDSGAVSCMVTASPVVCSVFASLVDDPILCVDSGSVLCKGMRLLSLAGIGW